MKSLLQKTVLIVLVLLLSQVSFSQKREVDKANKDFDKYAYIDARDVYLKVVEDGYTSAQIYKNLGDTYYWNSDYDNAAKWYLKLIDEFSDEVEVDYYYRAAQSLKSIDQEEQSKQYMAMYIDNGGDPGIIRATSTNFLEYAVSLSKVSINTASSDFGPSYYLDKLVFASTSKGAKLHTWNDQPFLDLFVADMDDNGMLRNVEPLGGDINTAYHESSTAFTKDGATVYFTRNNFIDGKKGKDKNKTIRLKLYKATKSGDNFWTNIIELPFNSKSYSVAHPALSLDEKRLYFSSDMGGTTGMSDLWYVDILEGDTYGDPVNLTTSINTEARESFPFISQGNNLYFASDGRGGLGGYDVFMVALDDQGRPTGEVKNLGAPTNSNQDDFGFIINEDKRIGYVSSNRDGDSGSIADDIYRIQEKCEVTITGLVSNAVSGEVLPGAVVTLLDSDNRAVASVTAGPDGRYSFEPIALCDSQYIVRGKSDGCEFNEKLVRTPNVSEVMDVPLALPCDPCPPNDLGCRLSLEPIYFDFDRYNIREDAAIELAKILAAMRQYPELIIHIESHTDSRAPNGYNERLSEKRAQSTLNWLVDQGISRSRLTAKGYGEYQLVNQCSDGVECTEEEHQLNRRSMFLIQN